MITDPSLKFLPRRYRNRIQKLLQVVYENGRYAGVSEGKRIQKEESQRTAQNLRVDISMSIQKLADSNAQIATCLSRVLEKLV